MERVTGPRMTLCGLEIPLDLVTNADLKCLSVTPIRKSSVAHRPPLPPVKAYVIDREREVLIAPPNALPRFRECEDARRKHTRPPPPPPLGHDTTTPSRWSFRGSLRDDLKQGDAVSIAMQHILDARRGCALLSMATGQGKTVVALWIASLLRVPTLVLTHRVNLSEQWRVRCDQYLPHARVTEIRGPRSNFSGDVCIASIQTLINRNYSAELERFELLIVDEVHHMAAATFSRVMFGLHAPYKVALSATPDRKDGMDDLIQWWFGPPLILPSLGGLGGDGRTRSNTTQVRLARFSSPEYATMPLPTTRRGDLDYVSFITRLVEHRARTDFIADIVYQLTTHERRTVLVLSHRRDHCLELHRIIQGKVQGTNGAPKQGQGKDGAPELACEVWLGGGTSSPPPDAQILISTFSMCGEGVDITTLDTIVLATPASDVRQAVGRVTRGGRAGTIVDIVDHGITVTLAQAAKRCKAYRAAGYILSQWTPDRPSFQFINDEHA